MAVGKVPYLKSKKSLILSLLLTLLVAWLCIVAVNAFSTPAKVLGVENQRLAECPASPNCVSTQAERADQAMEPIRFEGSSEQAMQVIRRVLESLPRTRIESEDLSKNYVHATTRSLIFRFADDVEFFFDESNQVIHFRSSSRIGYSDFGANRARMEQLQQAILAQSGLK